MDCSVPTVRSFIKCSNYTFFKKGHLDSLSWSVAVICGSARQPKPTIQYCLADHNWRYGTSTPNFPSSNSSSEFMWRTQTHISSLFFFYSLFMDTWYGIWYTRKIHQVRFIVLTIWAQHLYLRRYMHLQWRQMVTVETTVHCGWCTALFAYQLYVLCLYYHNVFMLTLSCLVRDILFYGTVVWRFCFCSFLFLFILIKIRRFDDMTVFFSSILKSLFLKLFSKVAHFSWKNRFKRKSVEFLRLSRVNCFLYFFSLRLHLITPIKLLYICIYCTYTVFQT